MWRFILIWLLLCATTTPPEPTPTDVPEPTRIGVPYPYYPVYLPLVEWLSPAA